ncbi:hypothetical protein L6452_00434 [Arctium lappa]|uniref:Uncharacterized protein n=1 Tax=Arctium lappa TaxID=4217 RepID=A0ACB9FEI1_ARCLA|nr:hypothetical protein L6452_00434 [Arctium lappa]
MTWRHMRRNANHETFLTVETRFLKDIICFLNPDLGTSAVKNGALASITTYTPTGVMNALDETSMGYKVLEAVDLVIRIVAEKHQIDYQLSKLDNGNVGPGEEMNIYESIDDVELSFCCASATPWYGRL